MAKAVTTTWQGMSGGTRRRATRRQRAIPRPTRAARPDPYPVLMAPREAPAVTFH